MKNWLDKMERRFGRYAIRNLTMYLLAGYAIGYLLSFTMPQLLTYFTLEPALILKGQVWRLLSWVIIPPNDNIIFVIFMMLLYYSLGNTLESYWGAFRYNVSHFFRNIIYSYRSLYCEWTDRRHYLDLEAFTVLTISICPFSLHVHPSCRIISFCFTALSRSR